jgi:hypothetical protein
MLIYFNLSNTLSVNKIELKFYYISFTYFILSVIYLDYHLLYTRVMYKNFLAVMYVRFMVTPDDGYFTRNM